MAAKKSHHPFFETKLQHHPGFGVPSSALNLEDVIRAKTSSDENESNDKPYIDMFWLDAMHKNGVIHLFGVYREEEVDGSAVDPNL